jgi:hypothetical protein
MNGRWIDVRSTFTQGHLFRNSQESDTSPHRR